MNLKLISILFLSLTTISQAAPIQMGAYPLGSCRVEVRPGDELHTIEMRLDQGSQFASISFDLRREKTNAFSGFYGSEFKMQTAKKHSMNLLKYEVRMGGTWSAIDAKAYFEFDRSTGLLKKWSSQLDIAKISLPNFSVAPIKSRTDQLNCE